jgi:hypothetical protein
MSRLQAILFLLVLILLQIRAQTNEEDKHYAIFVKIDEAWTGEPEYTQLMNHFYGTSKPRGFGLSIHREGMGSEKICGSPEHLNVLYEFKVEFKNLK